MEREKSFHSSIPTAVPATVLSPVFSESGENSTKPTDETVAVLGATNDEAKDSDKITKNCGSDEITTAEEERLEKLTRKIIAKFRPSKYKGSKLGSTTAADDPMKSLKSLKSMRSERNFDLTALKKPRPLFERSHDSSDEETSGQHTECLDAADAENEQKLAGTEEEKTDPNATRKVLKESEPERRSKTKHSKLAKAGSSRPTTRSRPTSRYETRERKTHSSSKERDSVGSRPPSASKARLADDSFNNESEQIMDDSYEDSIVNNDDDSGGDSGEESSTGRKITSRQTSARIRVESKGDEKAIQRSRPPSAIKCEKSNAKLTQEAQVRKKITLKPRESKPSQTNSSKPSSAKGSKKHTTNGEAKEPNTQQNRDASASQQATEGKGEFEEHGMTRVEVNDSIDGKNPGNRLAHVNSHHIEAAFRQPDGVNAAEVELMSDEIVINIDGVEYELSMESILALDHKREKKRRRSMLTGIEEYDDEEIEEIGEFDPENPLTLQHRRVSIRLGGSRSLICVPGIADAQQVVAGPPVVEEKPHDSTMAVELNGMTTSNISLTAQSNRSESSKPPSFDSVKAHIAAYFSQQEEEIRPKLRRINSEPINFKFHELVLQPAFETSKGVKVERTGDLQHRIFTQEIKVSPKNKFRQAAKASHRQAQSSRSGTTASIESTSGPVIVQKILDDDEVVELLPLNEEFRQLDRIIYAQMLHTLRSSKTISINNINRCMNAIAPLLQEVCTMLLSSCDSLWESLLVNKNSMDLITKLSRILDGISSCHVTGVSSKVVSKVNDELLPLLSSPIVNELTSQWESSCELSPAVTSLINPLIDIDTGIPIYKKYSDFFEKLEGLDMSEKLRVMSQTVNNVKNYSSETMAAIHSKLPILLHDWVEAKTVYVEMDARLHLEKEIVRKQVELKIRSLGGELNKLSESYEAAQAKNEELMEQIKRLQREGKDTRLLQEKLIASEHQIDVDKALNDQLRQELYSLTAAYDELKAHNKHLTNTISHQMNVQDNLNKKVEELMNQLKRLDVAVERASVELEDYQVLHAILL